MTLKALREKTGLSKRALALAVGMEPGRYSRLESGGLPPVARVRRTWTPEVMRLSSYYGIEPDDLFPRHQHSLVFPDSPETSPGFIDWDFGSPEIGAEFSEILEHLARAIRRVAQKGNGYAKGVRIAGLRTEGYTFMEIGEMFNLSSNRIMDLERKAHGWIRHYFEQTHDANLVPSSWEMLEMRDQARRRRRKRQSGAW